MIHPRVILRILAALACAPLVSCIDGHEEFWLNPDGSGRAKLTYDLPAIAARSEGGEEGVRKKVESFLTGNPAFRRTTHEVTTDGDRLRVTVEVAFDSVLDLKKLRGSNTREKLPSSASHLAGKFDLRMNGRSVEMTRTISPGKALPGSFFLPASQFEGRKLVYIIHLPHPARETNATEVTNGGRTLTWEHAVYDGIREPLVTHFITDLPIPKKWIAAASVSGVLVIALLAVVIRKLKPRRRL